MYFLNKVIDIFDLAFTNFMACLDPKLWNDTKSMKLSIIHLKQAASASMIWANISRKKCLMYDF